MAAVLCAAAWIVAGGGAPGPQVVEAQPGAAAAEVPGLRPVAHVGGRLNGLAVDGDTVYIGEGPDVVMLRLDADAQLTVAHRTLLPEAVTSLAIAPEVDRLYAAAGDAVYALAIADGRPPTVVGEVAVPLADESRIVAKGTHVYARVEQARRNQSRCIAAITFDGPAGRGTVGPSVCATDIPANAWLFGDKLTLGNGVLAVYAIDQTDPTGVGIPVIALFDVRVPTLPRFARSMALPGNIENAVMAGDRLWTVDYRDQTITVRSFDVSDPDREPIRAAEWAHDSSIDQLFVADGLVWLNSFGLRAYHPDAVGAPQPAKQRLIHSCHGSPTPFGEVTLTHNAYVTRNASFVAVCRMPADDRHEVHATASWYDAFDEVEHVAAAGGRTFALGSSGSWLTQLVHGLPTGLVRYGTFQLPPIMNGAEARDTRIQAVDADPDHLVVAQNERLSAYRLPVDERPVPAATWSIPVGAKAVDAEAVAVAGERAVVLRSTELFVVDLARPEAPVARLADRWRGGRALAAGPDWAAVLAGNELVGGRTWAAPQIVLVDVRSAPPVVLGELTMTDWTGWYASGIARVGDHLAVALRLRTGGTGNAPLRATSEVVLLDASDPSQPAVVGRAAIAGDAGAEAHSIAATADGLVIVGGWVVPQPDPAAPPDRAELRYRGGLWVIDVEDPAHPVVGAPHAGPGYPMDIAVDGRSVLVASGQGGLRRYELVRPGDGAAKVWRLALPWLGPGEREARGQPVPVLRSATTAP